MLREMRDVTGDSGESPACRRAFHGRRYRPLLRRDCFRPASGTGGFVDQPSLVAVSGAISVVFGSGITFAFARSKSSSGGTSTRAFFA